MNNEVKIITAGTANKTEYLKYIDIELLNDIMLKITKATGMGIAACDYTGGPVAGAAGYCSFCKLVQENLESKRSCEASTAIGEIQSATTNKPYIYVCPQGLLEVSIPINVNGKFMGGVVAGQIYCENIPDNITRVSSIFPEEVLCADKYPEERKNCTRMTFEEFNSTAQMIYSMLTELFKAKVEANTDNFEVTNIVRENTELKEELKKIKDRNIQGLVEANFLLGALNSIANKAAIEGAVDTNETVGILSEIIEDMICLNGGKCFLCDEIRIIERYIKLQQLRVDDLEFEINIPEETKLYRIPSMIVFPLVEYSVYCGLLYKENKKKLTVDITEDEKYLKISISDNGLGIKYQEVKALYPEIVEEMSSFNRSDDGREAYKNRLELLFGGESEITVNMQKKKGTVITLNIPISFAKGDE